MNRRDVFSLPLAVLPPLAAPPAGDVSQRIAYYGTVSINGGLVGWDDHVKRQVIAAIREAVDGKDVILFDRDSRQARLLTDATRDAD